MSFLEKLFQTVQPSLDVEELKKDDEFKKISQSHPMIYYEKIIEVIGNEATEKFYQTYKDNGITKKDIDSLAAWGFRRSAATITATLWTASFDFR